MKHKVKPKRNRKPFKRKQGGGAYRLTGDARYRASGPSIGDLLPMFKLLSKVK